MPGNELLKENGEIDGRVTDDPGECLEWFDVVASGIEEVLVLDEDGGRWAGNAGVLESSLDRLVTPIELRSFYS